MQRCFPRTWPETGRRAGPSARVDGANFVDFVGSEAVQDRQLRRRQILAKLTKLTHRSPSRSRALKAQLWQLPRG